MYCTHCPESSIYNTPVTTNFRRHLEIKHQIKVVEDLSPLQSEIIKNFQQLYQQANTLGRTKEIELEVFEKSLDQEMINEALVSLIIIQNLSYRIVEWPEFHTFCLTLNPKADDYLTTAHSIIPKMINKTWYIYKDIVQKKL